MSAYQSDRGVVVVKCKDCGFLSLKLDPNVDQKGLLPGTLVEANLDYRDSGRVMSNLFSNEPMCFVRSYHLMQEIEYYQQSSGWPNANSHEGTAINLRDEPFKWAIYLDRDCDEKDKFIGWQQGFSPREHIEMDLREKQQAYLAQQRELDVEWRDRQEEKADRRHKMDLIIIGILATLFVVAATLAGAAIQARWVDKWFGLGN